MRSTVLLSLAFFMACSNPTKQEAQEDPALAVVVPSATNSSLPYLITGDDGNLYFSWVEKKDSGWVELKYSTYVNDSWSAPELIAKGNDWFVNWADYPMMAVDSDGNMMAHYLAKSAAGTYAYDVNIVMKKAGGSAWSDATIPHNDGTPTEHGFTTMLPQGIGIFQISWLDGRNTGGGDHDNHGDGGGGAMTIRTALLDMDGNLSDENVLDQRVCDCCQTTGANTVSGPVVLFRDRSEMEIRDLSIVRNVNKQWTEPTPVYQDNWNIAGCPVNGPRADAVGNSLAVAWYSAANNQPEVKVAFS
ncbi:MAG: exo-alpha-sialidase, partial [Cyclobacteriaceae bacterium]